MKYFFVIALFICSSCRQSCSKDEAKKVMGDWFLRKIELPENMRLINSENVDEKLEFNIYTKKSHKYILHYFLADCDKCVNELQEIQSYFNAHKEQYKDTKLLLIATGPIDLYVKDAAKKLNFQYPIYFDKDYQSFKISNKLPLGDKLYNTMLLDGDDKLLIFGAFYSNSKAEKLYEGLISCD
ncbi:hypothetical protein AY601_1115 [Pedobacter cryoconitis]|uniref:AhpC/TSA family protein n=1 Tax=Pedobacter cryoconitis TaxID=188932 RepID=A0A127V9G0_9SPHI|nr:hypothetical protein [Pedobacter cryoconitis]AMP98042.1 hypothetical protein AY601_1115 [Pedobacter cryoconitis]